MPQQDSSGNLDSGYTHNRDNSPTENIGDGHFTEKEELYRLLVESIEDYAIFILDPEGNVSTWNSGAERIKGYRAQEIIGQSFGKFYTDEDRTQGIPAKILDTARTTGHYSGEGWRLRRDGSRFWASVVVTPLYESSGVLKGFAKITRDISERMRYEQNLQESEERYKILSEAAYEGLILHNLGIIQETNQRFAEMFGYNSEDLIGWNILDLVAPEIRQSLWENLVRDYQRINAEIKGVRKDGSLFFLELRGKAIEFRGEPVQLLAVRDISELKQAEEALRFTQSQLLHAQKMESVGRMAGGVAHDFNNLLTAIMGYSDLALITIGENEPGYKYLTGIQNAVNRASDLTRQLLAFSRKQLLKPRVINLNNILENIESLLQHLINEDIELVLIRQPDLGVVLADPGQIEQVIVNLVVNARDAMPGGGRLTIETARVELDEAFQMVGQPQVKPGSYIMLAVSDTGTGMDQTILQKIFEPFFTNKENGKGTGLGLATVYGIVLQSEGYIFVYSEVGLGTIFKIFFPEITEASRENSEYKEAEQTEPNPVESDNTLPATRASLTGHNGYRVLVVEDDGLVRNMIYQVLIQDGFNVLLASDGQEALTILSNQAERIDLVLTDIIMPKMGGRELIEQIKKAWPRLKIVWMSGYTDKAVPPGDLQKQSTSYLQKPFTSKMILQQVKKALQITK